MRNFGAAMAVIFIAMGGNALSNPATVVANGSQALSPLQPQATYLERARAMGDNKAVVEAASKLSSSLGPEFDISGFIKALLEFDKARALEALGDTKGSNAAQTKGQELIRRVVILHEWSFKADLDLAVRNGFTSYAATLQKEVDVLAAMGRLPQRSAVDELTEGQAGLLKLRDYREKVRAYVINYRKMGGILGAQWAEETYRKLDDEYRQRSIDVASEQDRLKREAEEDRRRSAETWKAVASALTEASSILSARQQARTSAQPTTTSAAAPQVSPAYPNSSIAGKYAGFVHEVCIDSKSAPTRPGAEYDVGTTFTNGCGEPVHARWCDQVAGGGCDYKGTYGYDLQPGEARTFYRSSKKTTGFLVWACKVSEAGHRIRMDAKPSCVFEN